MLQPEVVQRVQQTYRWFQPNYLLADKGYDSMKNHRFLIDQDITPIIHIRKPSHTELHEGIYSAEGSPTCVGKQTMEYVRTDPVTGHHLFVCPPGGCALKVRETRAVRHCDTEVWEDPADQPRIVGQIPRASPLWKRLYRKRWSIERIFRSLKHSRNLEQHCFRGMKNVALHATLSVLTYSATALARLNAGDIGKMRLMRVNAP